MRRKTDDWIEDEDDQIEEQVADPDSDRTIELPLEEGDFEAQPG